MHATPRPLPDSDAIHPLPAAPRRTGRRARVPLCALPLLCLLAPEVRAQTPPAHLLWLWERPADLRWLKHEDTGIAYLRTSVRLSGPRVEVTRRRNPIRLGSVAFVMPVVHVDIDNLRPPELNETQRSRLIDALREAAAAAPSGWIQLDFEARPSQRDFYRTVLDALQPLRERHGGPVRLSVTALASWCMQDVWLDPDQVDEIVPMLFRMHRDGPAIRARLAAGQPLQQAACRHSAGVLREDPVPTPGARRRYWFSLDAWRDLPFEETP